MSKRLKDPTETEPDNLSGSLKAERAGTYAATEDTVDAHAASADEHSEAEGAAKDGSAQPEHDKCCISRKELEALRAAAAKADEHWDRYVRTAADLENYKKRAAREKQDTARFANESLLSSLMPVLDSFDRALAVANNAQGADVDSLKTGVNMINDQLRSVLADAGLEEIDATGRVFDPNLHEAVSQRESDEVPEGHVLEQLRKGYKFRERLLRAASVVVAKEPAN
jgi:molecular chaperone GrpE